MPNKYSHAFVLSTYGSHGLVDFDSSRSSKATSLASSPRSSTSPVKSKAQPLPSIHHASTGGPAQRLRLESPTRPRSKPIPPSLHSKSSSVETQIYAPLPSLTPPPTRDAHSFEPGDNTFEQKASSRTISQQSSSSKTQAYTPHERHVSQGSPSPPVTQKYAESIYSKFEEPLLQRLSSYESSLERCDRISTNLQNFAPQHLPYVEEQTNWRHGSVVAFGNKSHSSSNTILASAIRRENDSHNLKDSRPPRRVPHNRYGRTPFAAQPFAPERPPSPPATPDSESSFSLKTSIEEPDPTTLPPPIPERSARRSPPGSSSKLSSPTSPTSNAEFESSRPMTSPSLNSPNSPTGTTFSITTRTSSDKAATTPPSNPQTLSMPSVPSFDDQPELDFMPGTFYMPSQPFAIDDEDLESLPSTYVPSNPDFNIEPWSNDNTGPAIFRDGELNSRRPSTAGPVTTRASSFDSAAPPPIGMDRRVPPLLTETTPSNTPKTPKSHQRSKPSLISLAFFRSAPKAILYSQTRPRTPPVPVSVSRTAVPSIPALFPCYKGPFPPPSERHGEHSRRGRRDANRLKQARGRSLPPRDAERRRSWFKADPVERSSSFCHQSDDEERI